MSAASEQTTPGAGRRRGLVVAAALTLGLVLGCFRPEQLAYTPCEQSDSCAEAGLYGCLRLPDEPGVRGSCTDACELDDSCPPPPDGDATPHCAEIEGSRLCVLLCMDDETCPKGQVCTEAAGVDGGVARLCFPEAA